MWPVYIDLSKETTDEQQQDVENESDEFYDEQAYFPWQVAAQVGEGLQTADEGYAITILYIESRTSLELEKILNDKREKGQQPYVLELPSEVEPPRQTVIIERRGNTHDFGSEECVC